MKHQRVASSILLALLLSALPSLAASQADEEPIEFGQYRIIPSQILGEDRVLQVYLPRGYHESEVAYPVVYLFYSDLLEIYYAQAVNVLSLLSIDLIPQVILVGVANTQRYRDLYVWPQEGVPHSGRADQFLGFVRDELIPFVDSEYRTEPYRIMVGPQAAAVFGAYALTRSPETFQAFLLNDPCRQDTDERSLCREVVEAAAKPEGGSTYFSVSHDLWERRWTGEHLHDLRVGLASEAEERFRWRIALVPDWPLFLAPVQLQEGLLDLFSDYPFDPGQALPDLAGLRTHYQSLSRRYGFTLDPPDHILAQSSDRLVGAGEHEEALEVLHFLMETYPSSGNGLWRLANLHRVMGDTATAIGYYQECLRGNPDMAPAIEWLERLGARRSPGPR